MRRAVFALLVLLSACATAAPPPTAESEIAAWGRAKYGDGFRSQQIFYGDFTGDGAADALAWFTYNDGGVRNFGAASLFRNEHGQMTYFKTDDTASGDDPREVVFSRGRISLTTTVWQDGDPRCCPTASQRWTIVTR